MPMNREILSRLLAQLPQPVPRLHDLHISLHWLIANCDRYAMATFLRPSMTRGRVLPNFISRGSGRSARHRNRRPVRRFR